MSPSAHLGSRGTRSEHPIPKNALAWACATAAVAIPALTTPAPADAALGDRKLRLNSTGPDVVELQEDLRTLGARRLAADGHFGRRTRRAVKRYERRIRITVDGRVSRVQGRGIDRRADARAGDRAPRGATVKSAPLRYTDGDKAVLSDDGRTALAPASAPQEVKDAIAAANRIVHKPYKYGGGHGRWEDSGYDCSGTVSYALHGAGLLDAPMASGGFMSWGRAGRGEWITIYAHGGHMYAVIAGLRLDTSGPGERGPRWRPQKRSSEGFTVRHPKGL